MPITSLIFGLNPDFDKRRMMLENTFLDKEDYYTNAVSSLSLKNAFFLNKEIEENEHCIIDSIKNISYLGNDWNNLGTSKISSEIIINSLKIIKSLPPSILNYLKPENIYPTKLGTIMMDWEIDNDNILSLEVARKSIGYFVEMNGEDYKEVSNIGIVEMSKITSSINNDLSILI